VGTPLRKATSGLGDAKEKKKKKGGGTARGVNVGGLVTQIGGKATG